jgi:hypothetical protein
VHRALKVLDDSLKNAIGRSSESMEASLGSIHKSKRGRSLSLHSFCSFIDFITQRSIASLKLSQNSERNILMLDDPQKMQFVSRSVRRLVGWGFSW